MIAFDRDGVLVGVLGDFEASHPGRYQGSAEMPLIAPVINKINRLNKPVICISNQAGIKAGYTTKVEVLSQFRWLMRRIPELGACLFCPDDGISCVALFSFNQAMALIPPNRRLRYKTELSNEAIYRKPRAGMGQLIPSYCGAKINLYVGDLSGRPDYANGRDSDKMFARNLQCDYMDVNEFIAASDSELLRYYQ